MTAKDVTNTTPSPLGLPGGQIIDPKSTARVKNWEKIESNTVVKAWVAAGALTLVDSAVQDDDKAAPAPLTPPVDDNANGNGGPVVLFVPKTDEQLKPLTNAELAAYIEKDLGGQVKSGAVKDDLLAQIKDLSDAKVAANAAASSVTSTI